MLYYNIIKNMRERNPFLSNTDLAYDLLLEGIIQGTFKPEQRIQQDNLAEQFGMSRTPIRDALLKLEKERFVTNSGKQGFIVCPVRYSDYAELCKFRALLEEQAAVWGVQNFDENQLAKMRMNIEASLHLMDKSDEDKLMMLLKLDFEFHDIIIEGSDNRYLIHAYESNKSRFYFYQRIVRQNRYNISYTVNTHKQIYKAFVDRNVEQVRILVREHCSFYQRTAIQQIFERM